MKRSKDFIQSFSGRNRQTAKPSNGQTLLLYSPVRNIASLRLFTFYTFIFLLALTSCTSDSAPLTPAFYHWQTELVLDNTETHYLQTLGVRRLYVKFFDVDWDAARQEAIPKASLIRKGDWERYDIVPTIFITNRTLQELPASARSELATRMLDKINELWPDLAPTEIQIDCDWTGTTQVAYFELLTALKQQLRNGDAWQRVSTIPPVQLSVTLRLHQYRYPEQTGIPPADRAMLMFYNMGELTDWEEPNSILNLEKAQPYLLIDKKYPLALDIALPLFRWGVLFRAGKMIRLMPEIDEAAIRSVGGIALDDERPQRFEIPESTYLEGYYLYAGDRIRLETISHEQLLKAAKMLRGVASGDQPYVSFYHLDSALLTSFTPNDLQESLKKLRNVD